MRARDHRRTRPSRTAAPTCSCPISAAGAGACGATTSARTRLRRCPPGQNRRDGYAAGAMRNRRQDGRGPSSCSRLPSSDLGAPGRRRADRRKCTTGRLVRTDRVSCVPTRRSSHGGKYGSAHGGRTHCSGARRASVAVCGSLNERPSFPKGIWVSPR
jgi:hypothetical protein